METNRSSGEKTGPKSPKISIPNKHKMQFSISNHKLSHFEKLLKLKK